MTETSTTPRKVFPGLYELRALAALFIVHGHTIALAEFYGHKFPLPIIFNEDAGKLMVVLFLVLSGFLISFHLLTEKTNTKNISLKNFYTKRILRIWPLYLLIIFLSFFIFPQIPLLEMPNLTNQISNNFWTKLFLHLVMLPNLTMALFPPIPYLVLTWTIGIEEQFYAIWPILLKKFNNISKAITCITLTLLAIKLANLPILDNFPTIKSLPPFSIVSQNISTLASYYTVIAIGGITAYLLKNSPKTISIAQKKQTQIISLIIFLLTIFYPFPTPTLNFFRLEIFALSSSIIILNQATNKTPLINLKNKTLNKIGKISYGIYIFHPLAIVLSIKTFEIIHLQSITDASPIWHLALILISILISIAIAKLSYKYFESPFLKIKSKLSTSP